MFLVPDGGQGFQSAVAIAVLTGRSLGLALSPRLFAKRATGSGTFLPHLPDVP